MEKSQIRASDLKALCVLSNPSDVINPAAIARLVHDAPDPETAVREVLKNVTVYSDSLQNKWRQVITKMWSAHHPHLPGLLNLPIAADDVSAVLALQDAKAYLKAVLTHPAKMVKEGGEWLLTATDTYAYASQLPSFNKRPLLPIESEWQYLPLRRMRAVLQALRLVRRSGENLVLVKSRYQRWQKLPVTHQYYLLWHAETYHIDWSQYASIWGDYLKVVQEYLPVLWGLSANSTQDLPHDLRQWNQYLWESFYPWWYQAGLLERQVENSALFGLLRVHSLPTALTQVILRDLFERYGLVNCDGFLFAYTGLGVKLLAAERSEELPCALDLLP